MYERFKSYKRTRANFNFRKVILALAISFAMLIQTFPTPAIAAPIIKTVTVTFPSSTQQTVSQVVTIPHLKSVQSIVSSTGNATYLISGENVTVNVNGGTATGTQWNPTKLSKTVTKSLTSMSNNLASTYAYNDGTYLGTLYGQGVTSAYVQTGGSYTPADSYTASNSQSNTTNSFSSTMTYNSGGYSGILYKNGTSTSSSSWVSNGSGVLSTSRDSDVDSFPSSVYYPGGTIGVNMYSSGYFYKDGSSGWNGTNYYQNYKGTFSIVTLTTTYTQNYIGTVSRPESDTRTYGTQYNQDYLGTVYAGGYDNLYKYTVTIEYVDNSDPLLSESLPSENSYFGKEDEYNAISFSGSVKDEDVADNVTVKYTLVNNATGSNLAEHTNKEVMSPTISNGSDHNFNYTINVDETIADGTYTLRVWAEDDKGGVSAIKATNIIVDKSPPSVNVPMAIADSTTQMTVTPDAEDDLTGLHEMPYLYNRNGEVISSWVNGSLLDTELTPNTRYTYKYKARDSAGNESDYSEEIQRYTLALDPTGVETTSSTADSISLNIKNDEKNGESPESLIEVRLKSDGTVVDSSDWSVETEQILNGLNLDTEYELWLKVRNGDGVENEFIKVEDSFYSNQSPQGIIAEPTENKEISGQGLFTLSGKAWDKDQDPLTISVMLGGVEKIVEITNTPSEESGENNWSIEFQGSELVDGLYSDITVKITDVKGTLTEISYNYSLTVDKEAPTVNTPVVTVDGTTQITVMPVAEDLVTGLHAYPYLYNRNEEDVETWMEESLVDTGLIPNTQYKYRYKVRDAVGNFSDYSEEVSKYTFALNPTDVEITSATTHSITLHITNNEQNGEPPETIIEVRSKSDETIITTSVWSVETERVLEGLNLDTEYELWVKTRNGDGVENEFIKVEDSFYSNRLHQGSLTEPTGDSMITGHEMFTLSGRAWDLDRDKLTVSATVGGVEKTFELTDTPSERPDTNNWSVSFTGDDLPNGKYNLISIRIKDGKGEEINIPFNYTLTVAVTRIVEIKIEPETLEIPIGQTEQLKATAYYSNGFTTTNAQVIDNVGWSSSSPESVSVDGKGKIIGVAKGKATITASFEGKLATAEITVTDPVITSIEIQPERTVNLGNAFTLTAMATYSDGTGGDVTRLAIWTSLNPEIASVNHGTVIGISLGKTTIQAELEGVIGMVQVEVTHASLKAVNLEPDQSELQRGESLSVKAIAHYSDNKIVNVTNTATWSSLNPEFVSVDGTGKIKGLREGKAIIQAEFEGKLATAEITVIDSSDSEPSGSPTTNPKPTESTPTTPPVIPEPETTVPENVPDKPNPQTPTDNIQNPALETPDLSNNPAETTPTKPNLSNESRPNATKQASIQKGNQTQGNMKGNANLSNPTAAQLPDSLLNLPTRTTEIGVVKGHVKDSQGNPIVDARIELHSTPRVTYTDNKGFFQFANVEMGDHRIYLADESISKDLVLLNSITVKEGDQVKSMTGDQVANALGEKGIVETAQVQLSANDSIKELEIVVDMNSKGKGKWFSLAGLFPENFFSTENLLAGIGLSGSLLIVFVLFRFSRNTFIYVGIKCIRKRRAKLTQGELTLDLQKEFLKANGDNLKIVFSKSLSRKLAGKSITITEAGNVVTRLIAPEFAGNPLEIEVETIGE
ncbi:Ig-like domain-containing protein [Desulfosporosinus nitroreducens]|uniref:Ig-like domain-containing protein n=1 Tax=Desulfosporosinus nitroreducens TaxID=2018668 RepID=A0ABT8QW16_9FIRM|nr:Ig-like domain-containing protein [Desulfosporosinus nitroreducens]MDO0824086.1 Ig-like domain-containing protein [Desulfosporosinus nitroreducens]